jgi:hypothetical protein
MFVRRLLVLAVGLLVSVQVARNAAIAALSQKSPAQAFRIWPSHPAAEIALGMTQLCRATREQKPVAASIFGMIYHAAAKAPLAPEPFLVRGVQTALEGNSTLAKRAFAAAEWRDPRSLAARYFPGCPAQWIELTRISGEQQTEGRITRLKLGRSSG